MSWPKIRYLPEPERKPFSEWLTGQTRPWIDEEKIQDGYYPWDYERWKAGKPIVD